MIVIIHVGIACAAQCHRQHGALADHILCIGCSPLHAMSIRFRTWSAVHGIISLLDACCHVVV